MAEKIFRSYIFRKLLYACIVYSLISDAIRLNLCPTSADIAFNIIYIFAMIIFTFEIILQSSFDFNYRLSIFFWIDILSWFMVIYEFPWI